MLSSGFTLKGGQDVRDSTRDFLGVAFGSMEPLGLFASVVSFPLVKGGDIFEIQSKSRIKRSVEITIITRSKKETDFLIKGKKRFNV